MSQYKYIPPEPSIFFTIFWTAIFGSIIGFFTAKGNFEILPNLMIGGALIFHMLASFSVTVIKEKNLSIRPICNLLNNSFICNTRKGIGNEIDCQ